MSIKRFFISILLAAGALAVSCQEEKPVFGISADQDVIEFPQGGGTAQVKVTTAQAWTVKIPTDAAAWLSADPASGTGNATITFTAPANEGKDRKTGLKINAGMAGYVSVTVSQPGSQVPGDGLTPETAWSASEANAWVKANLSDQQVTSEKYYVKGIVHKVQTTFAASGTYGNAVFFISDSGQAAADDFEAYQVYYLGGKQWKKGQPEIEVGDEVIIYGPVTLYGSTAETSGKGTAYIYSHLRNGETPSPAEEDDYTKAEPKTVAEFIAAADKNTYYKLTGKVSGFNATYCSFDLEDATGKIYVFSVLDEYKTEWSGKIKNGGTITIAGKYDYYASKSQHEVVIAAILAYVGSGSGDDYTKAEPKTVAEFIAAADKNTYYKLSGTIGGTINTQYGNYDLTDASGTIYVFGTQNVSEYASKLVAGAKVTLAAKYSYYEQGQKHEAVDAYILSLEEGTVEVVTGTVAETIAVADGTSVAVEDALVMAKSKQGLIVTDGSANVYLFFDSKNNETVPDVQIGDKVKVEAQKASYGGVPEFKTPKVTKLSSGNQVSYPDPKDIMSSVASYAASVSEFITMTGTLKVSGNYFNIEFDGTSDKVGSISAPLDELGAASFDGKKVTVTGYFSGLSGSNKYINVVAVSIVPADPNAKYCTVEPASISVKADDTTASFNVKANAAWEAASDNADFVLTPSSGSADATVTVTFPANEGDAAKVAHINVVCADAGVNAVVTITQAKPSSGAGSSCVLDGEAIKAAHSEKWGYDSGAKSVTATDGSVWTLFNTYANTAQVTVQMNKGKGAYVLTPELPSGKTITKIAVVLNKKNDGTGEMGDRPLDILNADGTTTLLDNVTGQPLADGLEVPAGNTQVRVICDEKDGGAVYITSITVFYE